MTTARILAVDDEQRWLDNFLHWIPDDLAIQDSASTSEEAASLLRKFHYDLVLLDLSMDPADSFNRDNSSIQEYLAGRPEGTLYIVVSGTAERQDVRNALVQLGAWDVIFKSEIDPELLKEKVAAALADAYPQRRRAIEARTRLIKDQFHDNQILNSLQPRGGASSMYGLMDALFRGIAPIGQHRDRPYFATAGPCVCGLVWSRYRGAAVSLALANRTVEEEVVLSTLADWMGFPERGETLVSREFHRTRIRAFEEPSITDTYFDLPVVGLAQ